MSNAWNFAQRPPSVLSIRTKNELTKFQKILRVNGKSSKNEKSKFCKNLYIRLIFEKSFKIFHTPLKTILHTHIYSHAKFCGTALTIRHKKTLKVWKNRSQNSAFLAIWIHFISLWPNALYHRHKILHISSQVLRESPCQISASKSNFNYEFSIIFSPK